MSQRWFFSEGGVYTRLDCAEGLEFEIPVRLDCAEGLEFGGAKRRRKFWGFKVYRCQGKSTHLRGLTVLRVLASG